MKHVLAAASAFLLLSNGANAGTVDLSTWVENGFKGLSGSGNWVIQPGNDSVLQTINGRPTVFYEPGANSQGRALSGEITVETEEDDDFIGFVLGYQSGELNSTSADFWLIDWKQGDQGASAEGLALSHVTGNMQTADFFDFFNHVNVVDEVQRAATLGSTGWEDNTTYSFDLIFTPTLIEVQVNGVTELSYTAAQNGGVFSDGAFAFYNQSQDAVRYAGLEEDLAPIPLPAGLPLLLGGVAALALMRRRAV